MQTSPSFTVKKSLQTPEQIKDFLFILFQFLLCFLLYIQWGLVLKKTKIMAEKDIAEKNLEALNDVFADIVNVLLFKGKQIIHEDELEADTTKSIFKAEMINFWVLPLLRRGRSFRGLPTDGLLTQTAAMPVARLHRSMP